MITGEQFDHQAAGGQEVGNKLMLRFLGLVA